MKGVKLWTEKSKNDESKKEQLYLRLEQDNNEPPSFDLYFCDKEGKMLECGRILSIFDRGLLINSNMDPELPINQDFSGHASFMLQADFDIAAENIIRLKATKAIGSMISKTFEEKEEKKVKH